MFIVVVSICLVLFLVLAGADLLISNINSDELSNMGIEEKKS
jgi:preprotein translocase subunit SecE